MGSKAEEKRNGIVGGLTRATVGLCAFGAITIGGVLSNGVALNQGVDSIQDFQGGQVTTISKSFEHDFDSTSSGSLKNPNPILSATSVGLHSSNSIAGAKQIILALNSKYESVKRVDSKRVNSVGVVGQEANGTSLNLKKNQGETSAVGESQQLMLETDFSGTSRYLDRVLFNYKQGNVRFNKASNNSLDKAQEDLSNELWRYVSRGVLVEKVFESIHSSATFSLEDGVEQGIIDSRELFLMKVGKEISNSKAHKEVYDVIERSIEQVKTDAGLGFGSKVASGKMSEHERFVNNFEQQMRFLLSEDQKLDSSGVFFDGRSSWLTDAEFEKVEAFEKGLMSHGDVKEVKKVGQSDLNSENKRSFSEENMALAKEIMKKYGFAQINIDSAKSMSDVQVNVLLNKVQGQMTVLEKAMSFPSSESVGFDGKYQLHLSGDGVLKDFGRQAYVNANKSIFVINQGGNSAATLAHEWVHMLDGASGEKALAEIKKSELWKGIASHVKESWESEGVFFSEMPKELREKVPEIDKGFEQWWGAMQGLTVQGVEKKEGSSLESGADFKISELEVKGSGAKLRVNESNEFIKASIMLDERSKSSGMSNYWLRPTEMLARSIEHQALVGAGESFVEQKGKYAAGVAPKMSEEQAFKLQESIGIMLGALGLEIKDKFEVVVEDEKKVESKVGLGSTERVVKLKQAEAVPAGEAEVDGVPTEQVIQSGRIDGKFPVGGDGVATVVGKQVNSEIKVENLKGRLKLFSEALDVKQAPVGVLNDLQHLTNLGQHVPTFKF